MLGGIYSCLDRFALRIFLCYTTGATADGQIQQTLHNGTSGTAVGCLLAQTFNEFLLGLVDAPGDQVLREARRRFLRGFLTTGNQCALDQCGTLRRHSVR